ncbi:hypothetical protein QTP88_027152 [Uroleucon formosanum]
MFPNTTIRGCWFHFSQAVWRKVSNIGLIDICSNHGGAYDTVHMLMALPLLPTNCIAEGFETVRAYYIENVQSLISNNNHYNFTLLFEYYRSTWLAGINADILSVSDTVWRINNALEVSHQHLQMHMQNRHNPESWVFLKGLTTYSNGVLNDYNKATDGEQVREPQRQVWIDQQRNLDRSLRLFTERHYSMSEFLICARHSTPTFGVIRPQHQAIAILPAAAFPQAPLAILPLPVYQHQELQLPAIPVLPATALPQTPLQEAPALLPLHVDQHQKLIQDEIMRRILPHRPAVPVPRDPIIAKKAKLFVTPNRYEAPIADYVNSINPDNDNIDTDSQHETLSQEQLNTTNNTPKSILPPPVFIKDVLDYIGLRNSIRDLIGPTSFSCKSSTAHLKIQTDNPDNYRKLIRLLKDINAQYHTYQLHSEKSLRIVVKNLHPTTPVNEIAAAIEEIGHSVKNVTNIKHNLHFRCSLLISTLMKATTRFSPSLPYHIQKSKLKNRVKNGKYHNVLTADLMATPEPTVLTLLNASNAATVTQHHPV